MFEAEIATEQNRADYLDEGVVGQASFCYADVGDEHLGVGLELFVPQNSDRNENETTD